MGFHEFSSPYDWSRIASYKRTAKAAFGGMIDLSVGSPVDPVPDSVRKAIAESLNRRFDMGYTADYIFPTTGAAGALAHALRVVTKPGDEVLTFAPYFPEYQPYVRSTPEPRPCSSTPRTIRPARSIPLKR